MIRRTGVIVRSALWLTVFTAPPCALAAQTTTRDDAGVVEAAEDIGIPAQFTAMQPQPPATQPAAADRRAPARRTTRSSQSSSLRLASVPKMFGDVQFNGSQVGFVFSGRDTLKPIVGVVDVPNGGGARRIKIGENNSPLPEDRVVFLYNHFHNAINISENDPDVGLITRSTHVDRYTFGIEKTYWDQMASLEVRMPIVSSFDFATRVGDVSVNGGNAGNLALISKYLLYAEETWALGAGLALDLPTGSDVTIATEETTLTIHNDAVHLLPYVGLVFSPGDIWFGQMFAQLDFAANGNEVTGTDIAANSKFTDQNLLYLDAMSGCWLLRDPDAPVLTGVAAITELHYTSTIQDADQVNFAQFDGGLSNNFPFIAGSLTNQFNRIDVVNLTGGIQVELGNTTALRVAAVTPLGSSEDDRFFDTELQVQLNRRY